MTKTNVRELSLEILMQVTKQEQMCHILIRNVLDKYAYLEKQERSFLVRLTEGTIERMIELDHVLNQFSKVKVNKMKPVIRNILRMGIYQILYMDQIPDRAACDEAVKLARKKGFANLTGFVNGVLRNAARSRADIIYPDKPLETALSVKYSMPEWIVKQWLGEFGKEKTEQILKAYLSDDGYTTIRVRADRIEPSELKTMLEAEGITVDETPLPYAYRIKGYDTLSKLKAFTDGLFYVQDQSSMLAVEAAAPKGDEVCIDVCAAPGGKALFLAERLTKGGSVEARDLTYYKAQLIEENIDRCGLENVTAAVWDATELDPDRVGTADIVIADLPCSGLGVIGKKPDIKYNASPEKNHELALLQARILDTVSAYVKPGGLLIYSTCTINAEENRLQAEQFVKTHPFGAEALPEVFHNYTDPEEAKRGMVQLLPGEWGNDGFFIARLRRKTEN